MEHQKIMRIGLISQINLENIYNQGFHICNLYYGKRRENDENCMFCTEILFGEH